MSENNLNCTSQFAKAQCEVIDLQDLMMIKCYPLGGVSILMPQNIKIPQSYLKGIWKKIFI